MFHKILLMNFTKFLLLSQQFFLKNFAILFGMCCEEFVMKNFFIALSDNRSSLFIQHCPNLCISVFSLFRDSCLNRPPSLTDHFGLSDYRELILSTFQVSSVTRKLIIIASHLNRFPCAIDYNCKVFSQAGSRRH